MAELRLKVWAVVLMMLGTGLGAAPSSDVHGSWPAWRGSQADGKAIGNFPSKLAPDSPKWKLPLPGKGRSTPISWGDTILLSTPSDGKNAVMSVSDAGGINWITTLGEEAPPRHRRLGSSCNSSPITDGTHIFTYFKNGDFAALNFDGKVIWQKNLVQEYGPEELYWDQGSSPVVNDKHIILARVHGGESWIAAFDKLTGTLAWKTARNYKTPAENDNGYTTPILYDDAGVASVLVWGADHLTSYDVRDGSLRWWCGGFNPDGANYWPAISSPVIAKGIVVVPVGRDDRRDQASLYGIRLGGSGDVTTTHTAWKREKLGVFVSALATDGTNAYLLRNRGGIACVKAADGSVVYHEGFPESKDAYYSSPLLAGNILIAARNDGIVFTAQYQNEFKPLEENDLGEEIVASPAPFHNGILIRGEKHLFYFRD